jgi:hypothetical protein
MCGKRCVVKDGTEREAWSDEDRFPASGAERTGWARSEQEPARRWGRGAGVRVESKGVVQVLPGGLGECASDSKFWRLEPGFGTNVVEDGANDESSDWCGRETDS